MLKIFLSWSGTRSKKIATLLKQYLPILLHQVNPWMSSIDIYKGDSWSKEIGNKLDKHNIGIICVTPENQTAPWILFEAGAISKQLEKSKIFPLLLGMYPSEINGPLNQFQSTVIEKNDFKKLIQSINRLLDKNRISNTVLEKTFGIFWPEISKKMKKISKIEIEGTAINISTVTSKFGKYGFPEPTIGKHVYFSSGFESHNVYSTAFELATNRIWIWGRKNRKVFDKDHNDFYKDLRKYTTSGFDFKVLFLDPTTDISILSKAHKDEDFIKQLSTSINKAKQICESNNLVFSSFAKSYMGIRNTGMVIVDDAILYSPIQYDVNGCVMPLTKTSFSIIGADSGLGKDLENSFLSCWNKSESM